MWEKFLGVLATLGFIAAFIFYFLFDKEKKDRIVATRNAKVAEAKRKAQDVAREKHDEVKEKGSSAISDSIADMLDD